MIRALLRWWRGDALLLSMDAWQRLNEKVNAIDARTKVDVSTAYNYDPAPTAPVNELVRMLMRHLDLEYKRSEPGPGPRLEKRPNFYSPVMAAGRVGPPLRVRKPANYAKKATKKARRK